ncbi:MAG: hypothetical protein P1V19_05100, partial [Gimesia sp.]|nr:hypothetical protein [Gimesia sp.]
MKKFNYKSLVLICSLAITFSYPLYELSARGGRGGGGARGGASRGGGSRGGASRGGASRSRPSSGRTPSM